MEIKTLLSFITATIFAAAALLASSFVEASDEVWTSCGDQGENCDIAVLSKVLVRYGNLNKNNLFMFGVEGQRSVPCSNFIGNPSHDDSKQCWYNEDSSSIPPDDNDWNRCAKEGEVCSYNEHNPNWVRYGADGKWLYTIQTDVFTCDNNHFGWDPNKGTTKACYVGYPRVYDTAPDWVTCATEGQTCDLAALGYNNTGIIIRYGVDESWNYKIATQSDSIDCNDSNFYDPAVGTDKVCEVTLYQMAAVNTSGVWTLVTSCPGANCELSVAVNWGSTWSKSVNNQATWNVGVTESVSYGIEIPPETIKSSIGYSAGYADSTSYQKSLSTNYGETITAKCTGKDEYKAIYQFSTSSAADCLTGDGQCSSSTVTSDYICYTGDAPLPSPPQCLPNACVPGTYCTQCETDNVSNLKNVRVSRRHEVE